MDKIEQFNKWHSELSRLDRMNFDTLVTLPKAREIVEKMDDCPYKEWTLFVIEMRSMSEELEQITDKIIKRRKS